MTVPKVIDTTANCSFEWEDFYNEQENYPLFGWGKVEKVALREWNLQIFEW